MAYPGKGKVHRQIEEIELAYTPKRRTACGASPLSEEHCKKHGVLSNLVDGRVFMCLPAHAQCVRCATISTDVRGLSATPEQITAVEVGLRELVTHMKTWTPYEPFMHGDGDHPHTWFPIVLWDSSRAMVTVSDSICTCGILKSVYNGPLILKYMLDGLTTRDVQ